MQYQTSTRLVRALAVLVVAGTATGCGGGSDGEPATAGSVSEPATDPATDPADEGDAEDEAGGGLDLEVGTGAATVTVAGTSYEFGSADGFISVCTEAFGTLQVSLPLIVDGAPVDGQELGLIVLQPGVDDDETRDVYAEVSIPDYGNLVAGESGLAEMLSVETLPISERADGRTFSGTVEMTVLYDASQTFDVAIEATCG